MYIAIVLMSLVFAGCSSSNPTVTQKDLSSASSAAPKGDEAALADWQALVAKARSYENRKLSEREKTNLWTPGTTVDVRGDLRRTDSLTSPYHGEMVIFYDVPSGFSYKWTYSFTRDGGQWQAVSGIQEKTDKARGTSAKVTKTELAPSRVQEIVAEWMK